MMIIKYDVYYIKLTIIIQMNNPNEEKKMLIQSMKKLVIHVSNNNARQKEIFDALSLQDLNKIILNLKDDNQYLRRISALLLCELFYQNLHTKMGAVRLLSIQPMQGRICLSGIPESIYKYPSTLKKCIELMKSPAIYEQQEDKICWIINLERKTLKLELLEYKKYSSFTFIDPLKNIFGFIVANRSDNNNKNNKEKPNKDITKPTFQKFRQGDKKVGIDSPMNQSAHMNSQFYKNYLQARNKSKQSKRDSFNSNYMTMSLDTSEQSQKKMNISYRPVTTRVNTTAHQAYSNRKEDIHTSVQMAKTITLGHHSDVKTHINNKIHVTTPLNNYEPMSQNSLRQPKDTYNPVHFTNNSTFRQIQTDRRAQYGIKDVRSSLGYNNGSNASKQHQKLYKRVKEITKK